MEFHQDTFSTFTDNFPSHINRMRTTSGNRNSWGTHTEIFALATMLQTKVFVFCEYAGRFLPLSNYRLLDFMAYITLLV